MLISERPRCWGTYVVQTFPFKFGIHLPTPRIEMHPYVILICTERSLHWVVETYESDMLSQSDPVFLRINLLYSPNFTIMLVDERGCISLYMVLQWCMHAGDKHITYRCWPSIFLRNFLRIFKVADVDGSGALSKEEVGKYLSRQEQQSPAMLALSNGFFSRFRVECQI